MSGSTINYSILLWIITGLFLLRIDVVGFTLAKLEKEKKIARITGWFNLFTGLVFAAWSMFS